jgi:hypothetical protein
MTRSRSLQAVVVVVNEIKYMHHLRAAATAGTNHTTLLFVRGDDNDASPQLLASELAALDASSSPTHWYQIHLLAADIERATYDQLVHACSRLGNDNVGLRRERVCFGSLESLHFHHHVRAREGLDISLFNLFHFENQRLSPEMHAGHAAAVAPVATPPSQKQQRRVYVAAHCQQTPGEIAAEFVRADIATPPPSALLCANAACVNRAIDYSEFHIELVCTNEHITRVHNKQCEAALLGDRCLDCGEDTIARTVVRINERGKRIVKPQLTAAPAVTVAQAKIAPPAAAAQPRKSKAALRRERRAQQQLAAAAKKEVVDDDPEQHHPAATTPSATATRHRRQRASAPSGSGPGNEHTSAKGHTHKQLLVKKTKNTPRVANHAAKQLASSLDEECCATASPDQTATSDDVKKDVGGEQPGATAEANVASMVTRAEAAMQQSDDCVGVLQQQLQRMARAHETTVLQGTLESLKVLVAAYEQELQMVGEGSKAERKDKGVRIEHTQG